MAGTDVDLNNLSNDPEELMRAFVQIEGGATPAEVPAATPAPVPTDDIKPEDKGQQKEGTEQTEAEPQGVATKDGKHVIPYSVLKSERDRASRAEELATAMREQVAALQAEVDAAKNGVKTGEPAPATPSQPAETEISPEDLEALKEDFPTVYKAVMASQAAARALEAQLKPVQESMRTQEKDQARTAAEAVQDAIDSTPKLAHIQATNAEAFELAKQFDATLRTQSAWKEKPLADRFAKITEMVESALGPIDLPATPSASQATPEAIRAAALKKAQDSAKATGTNVPTSLSEFPAGTPPATDEQQAAEQMSVLQLAQKFGAMSPAQMDAYLQTM